MVPLGWRRASRACVPTKPLLLGFIPHATHPRLVIGFALYAISIDPSSALYVHERVPPFSPTCLQCSSLTILEAIMKDLWHFWASALMEERRKTKHAHPSNKGCRELPFSAPMTGFLCLSL
ncbi:hypothetical protein SUGI_1026190 [Cryptomeria japonica]|nr:hypothetical protein SUGI_1026190 [Cryptomeria japonica]